MEEPKRDLYEHLLDRVRQAAVTPSTWHGRLRSRVAGWLFSLSGKLDPAYDVWLDDAPRRERNGR